MSLKRNTIWNLAGTGLPLLLGVVAIPYLYRHLGNEKIGILTLVWALIGYFSLFDFGLGRALTQQVSASRAAAQERHLPGLVKSGLLFTAGTGLAGGLLLAILSYPLGFDWLNVSRDLQQNVTHSLLIAALGIPLTTVTTGLRGILEAYEDFRQVNLLRLLLGASNFGLPMLSVMFFGPSLIWVIVSLVVARFAVMVAHLILVGRKFPTGWHQGAFNLTQLRQLFSFGAWMTVTNVIGPLMVMADRFIISAVLGANVVAFYSIPAEMITRVLILPAALTSALFPRLTAVMANDPSEARRLYRKCLKVVIITLLPVCLIIALGSHYGLTLWLGKDFADKSWIIVMVMALGIFLNGIAHVPFAAVQATGNARATGLLHTFELFLYLPLLYFFLNNYGLTGAVVAWTVRACFDLVALLILQEKVSSKQAAI
ncbi:MAG TPA: flippase [Gallionellaceae bacterium]|jgi:O-antigen/teichoic acid export membrane protein|nr:MAG: polysaccharide biosynthesis protein [Polynucleobacter sp. 35-46-207]OZB48833.1 MAG: polysaccharide biosynthesis protein [Polynucleobacter sp. 39-45-136]HQS60064.1 flippase [Gallionellaceae bacterium]